MHDHKHHLKAMFPSPFRKPEVAVPDCNDPSHRHWDRRSFLQALGLAGGGSMMLGGYGLAAQAASPLAPALLNNNSDRVLVIIRLKGGVDGLNTIIPLNDYSNYANARPTLKINQSEAFNLSAEYAMPNFCNPLQSLWNNGSMKVVHGVGYDDQNLSHFRSSDIWASGTDADVVVKSGVWGRYFEEHFPDYLSNPPEHPLAIQTGSLGNLIFTGSDNTNYAFTVADPQQLYELAQNGWLHDMQNLPDCLYGQQLGYIRGIANGTFIYAGAIYNAYSTTNNSVAYPNTHLSKQLALVARLIKGGLQTKVYMVTLDGFDTHAEQADLFQALMTDVSLGVKAFYDDLQSIGMNNKVLTMTISEFGRRVNENGSLGTDHGAAAPSLFFGPGLNGNGFFGQHPSLIDVDNEGNMLPSVDFRQMYATVLEDWLCIDPQAVDEALLSVNFERLELGFECISGVKEKAKSDFKHTALYMPGGDVVIEFEMKLYGHVTIQLFDIMGRLIANLSNAYEAPGTHRVSIRNNAGTYLAPGQYIYRINTGGRQHSRSVVLAG
jgi:uncharacterized protein (DUF1501 family)